MTPPSIDIAPPDGAAALPAASAGARAPRRRSGAGWARHSTGAPVADGRADAARPVRLLEPSVPSPFAPGRSVVLARVAGSLLEPLGVRDGDHVALERTDRAEHGDLAAVLDPWGRSALWRVYAEGDALRLSTGDPAHARRTGPHPRVQGVVVGILRKF